MDRIAAIACPKLIVAGECDEKVPYQCSKKIYDLAKEPKEWHLVPGMQHRYQYQSSAFLNKVNDIIIQFVEK